MASKTFIKITNRDIYEKLGSIEKAVSKTNGTVKVHSWAIGVLLLIVVAMIKIL